MKTLRLYTAIFFCLASLAAIADKGSVAEKSKNSSAPPKSVVLPDAVGLNKNHLKTERRQNSKPPEPPASIVVYD